MGVPQLENGYTRVANELLEAIGKQGFTATQYGIILCVIRYTYGYGRKTHPLSMTFLAKWTGKSVRGIKSDFKRLVEDGVLYIKNSGQRGTTYEIGLNKDFIAWRKSIPIAGETDCTGEVNCTSEVDCTTLVKQTAPLLVKCTSPNKRKNKKKEYKDRIGDFFETVWNMYPKKRGKESVSAKAKKELYDAGMDIVTAAIEKYKRETEGTDERYVLYGSTFFNSRWKDYIPDPVGGEIETIKPSESKEDPPIDLWGGD